MCNPRKGEKLTLVTLGTSYFFLKRRLKWPKYVLFPVKIKLHTCRYEGLQIKTQFNKVLFSLSRHLFWIRRANIVLSARCCQQCCCCCCCCRKQIARNYVCCTKCKWLFSGAVRRNYRWQVLSALFPNTTYSSLQGVLLIRSIGPLFFFTTQRTLVPLIHYLSFYTFLLTFSAL